MSKYKRQEMEVDESWSDIFPEGFRLFKIPELPKVQFKVDGVKYECTDLRYLDRGAVNCFLQILGEIGASTDCNEVGFDVAGADEDEVNRIIDIVMGIKFGYSKGGKHGFMGNGCFVMGVRHEGNGDSEKRVFEVPKDIADSIRKYSQGKEELSYEELVVAVGKDSVERLLESRRAATE